MTTSLPHTANVRRPPVGRPFDVECAARIGTAAALAIMPMVFVFAFAVHPDLGQIRVLPPEELISRARGNELLHFAHALVTLNTALLVIATTHLYAVLRRTSSGMSGLIGATLAVFGACLLAADKGALCLTMSALDTTDSVTFAAMMPGMTAIFSTQGWVVLVRGMVLLPLGFAIQAVGLLRSGAWPMWQAVALLGGSLLIGAPDGMEIVNLAAALTLCLALIPEAVRLTRSGRSPVRSGSVS